MKTNYHFNFQSELERKKAEVRARLESEAAGKKAKKGFVNTPDRKYKLRVREKYRASGAKSGTPRVHTLAAL